MRRLALVALVVLGCSQRSEDPRPAPRVAPPSAPPVAPPAPSDRGVRARIFADDVPTDSLALSISIETLGGLASPLIPRGKKLPVEYRDAFSTSADDQTSVEVHVLQGERPLARDNRSLGKFQLTGIPPAPRGVPQIDVTFAIDATGVLAVSAKDRATGASREIRIEAAQPGTLDQRAVAAMLADAEAHRAEDEAHRVRVAAHLELQTLVYTSRKLLADTGAKLPAALRLRCERALQRAGQVSAGSWTEGDVAPIRAATEALRTAIHAVSTLLYAKPP